LEIQDTLIRNFSSDGMVLSPNATSTFSVVNSVVSHNVRDGIDIIPSGSGSIHGLLDRLVVDNSGGDGVLVLGTSFTGSINVTVRDSSVVSNGLIGIVSTSTATATPTTVTVQNSTIAYNNTGLDASGAAGILRVTKSVITGNNGGVATSVGGTLESFGDNVLRGNTTNGSPTASVALQ
jgi:hypothetical protein